MLVISRKVREREAVTVLPLDVPRTLELVQRYATASTPDESKELWDELSRVLRAAGELTVSVADYCGGKVRLGFTADRLVRVYRTELLEGGLRSNV